MFKDQKAKIQASRLSVCSIMRVDEGLVYIGSPRRELRNHAGGRQLQADRIG